MYKKDISQEAKQTKSPINSQFYCLHTSIIKATAYICQRASYRGSTVFYQWELAQALGLRREAVNRITNTIHDLGLIYKERQGYFPNGLSRPCRYVLSTQLQISAVRQRLIAYVRNIKTLELTRLWVDRTLLKIKGIIYKKNTPAVNHSKGTPSHELPFGVGRYNMQPSSYYNNEQLAWPPGMVERMPRTNKLSPSELDMLIHPPLKTQVLKHGGVPSAVTEQYPCEEMEAWEAHFSKKHAKEEEDASTITNPWSYTIASGGAQQLPKACDRESNSCFQKEVAQGPEQPIPLSKESLREPIFPEQWYEDIPGASEPDEYNAISLFGV